MKNSSKNTLQPPELSGNTTHDYRALLEDARVAELLENVADGFIFLDPGWRITHLSSAAERHCGRSRSEVVGHIIWEACPDVAGGTFETECRRAMTTQQVVVFEGFFPVPDTWFGIKAVPSPTGLFVSFYDITRRRAAETALLENQQRVAGIISSAMDAIITVDSAQRVTLFNAAAEKMFGYVAAEALGQPLDRFLPDRYRKAHRRHIESFGETRVTRRSMGSLGTLYGLRANGEEFPIEASISQMESGGQRFYTVILRDITERKRAEERLLEQAAMLNLAKDAIIVRDPQGRVIFWNQGAERMYGWAAEEAVGQDVRLMQFPASVSEFEKANRAVIEQGTWSGELQQLARDGRKLMAECNWTLIRDASGQPKSILAINTDITEKKKLEAQFLRAQRMESIGTLAGGIAHDLNNVLSPMLMAVQMLQLKVTDEQGQRMLDLLRTNAERGGEMVRQVLSFARGIGGERAAMQSRHLIREIVKILKETFPKSIEISFRLGEDLAMVNGDTTQLHQVLMNLCINARDAMPDGGRLTIEAENKVIDETYAQMILDARPGRFVMITVTDTGTGIPTEHLDRIFDPFFTTKEVGKGTGLGLSTVLGIIKGHGGFINVYSEPGKGTQFRIYLPALEIPQLAPSESGNPALPAGRGETILVVDDELAIREITSSTLEAFNYRVLTANDGAEAIALYAQHRNEIRVVLTDMMMPFMDGPALIRALRKINPEVRIIASSGLTENGKAAEITQSGVRTFLAKPYSADKLLKALAEVLSDK
ncbi:MAG: PAS domain S-box protein [Blastocatellia bacterium]